MQLDCLPIILAGAEAGAIDRRPASGKWSARENLAHLARYDALTGLANRALFTEKANDALALQMLLQAPRGPVH